MDLTKLPTREAKPDYNPDREGHAEKKFLVMPGLGKMDSIELDGQVMKFGKNNALWIKDEAKARAVQQKYGVQTAVTRMRYPSAVSDRGHKFFFGQMPAMPWHHYDEQGNRIREDEHAITEGQEQQNNKPEHSQAEA